MRAIERVGVVGAGRMGLPIVGHLARKGFSVLVSDLNAAKRATVEGLGAHWSDTTAVARSADVILVCVGFDVDVQTLLDEGGPLRAAKRGTIVAILATVNPKTVQRFATELADSGIVIVDAPVCRGGPAADAGKLLSFVGGTPETVARLTPVLSAYSADIVHTGGVGTAQVAKAVNNLIMWACLVADHEGLALAQRHGVDVEALRKALLMSSAANGALENWGNQTMAWAQDDMAIVAEMADDCGISLPQAGIVREICRTLKARRYQLDDYGR